MISNALTLVYIVTCFIGLQCATFIVIAVKRSSAGSSRLLKVTRNFILASLFVGIYYFFTYYKELVLGEFEASVFMRALDAVQFYVLGLTWVQLMDALIQSENPKLDKWRKGIKPIFSVLMVLSVCTYVFLLDNMYIPKFHGAEYVAMGGEVILGISVVIFTVVFALGSKNNLKDRDTGRYILAMSILVNFSNLWNNIIVVAVFAKQMELTLICSKLYGITAVALLLINLYSLIYIYKKDFSPLFSSGREIREDKHMSEGESIDYISQKYRLTEREREVMMLAYGGMTNPDIAQELFISKNTVKRHMYNIFEKLHVSTRVELVHMINSQRAEK